MTFSPLSSSLPAAGFPSPLSFPAVGLPPPSPPRGLCPPSAQPSLRLRPRPSPAATATVQAEHQPAAPKPPALPFRVGHGFDLHRLESDLPLIIGGINIPHVRDCAAHSDFDVLLHCVVDAILGALGLPATGLQPAVGQLLSAPAASLCSYRTAHLCRLLQPSVPCAPRPVAPVPPDPLPSRLPRSVSFRASATGSVPAGFSLPPPLHLSSGAVGPNSQPNRPTRSYWQRAPFWTANSSLLAQLRLSYQCCPHPHPFHGVTPAVHELSLARRSCNCACPPPQRPAHPGPVRVLRSCLEPYSPGLRRDPPSGGPSRAWTASLPVCCNRLPSG
eukprot:XP_020398843.1 uncharacterized protein LOC109941963 [Zea mays]